MIGLSDVRHCSGLLSTKPRTAKILMFPPHRDMRFVAKLILAYLRLVRERGDRAYAAFRQTHERPIVARLMALGASADEAQAEILRVHQAMATMSLSRQAMRISARRAGGQPA